MDSQDKLVYFKEYCAECKHTALAETEDPCFDCLANPSNTDSHKPVFFEEK